MAGGTTVGVRIIIARRMENAVFAIGVACRWLAGITATRAASTCTSSEVVGDGLYFSRRERNVVHSTNIGNSGRNSASRSAVYARAGCAVTSRTVGRV